MPPLISSQMYNNYPKLQIYNFCKYPLFKAFRNYFCLNSFW
jgi:hypothetical protein